MFWRKLLWSPGKAEIVLVETEVQDVQDLIENQIVTITTLEGTTKEVPSNTLLDFCNAPLSSSE